MGTAPYSFGSWLRLRRKSLDLTQEELARLVNCSVGMIRLLESGERRPSRQIAELLADHLKVTADQRSEFLQFARSQGSNDAPAQGGRPEFRVAGTPRPANLPAMPGPLLGRDGEMSALRNRLLRDRTRLLTLVGPPGIGKTRLAVELARDLAGEFEGGAFFVSLAPISDPELVPTTIWQALALHGNLNPPTWATLKQALREAQLLLVLDNVEQVVAAAPWVGELLSECPDLYIIATSREPLRLRIERQFTVPPLVLPPTSVSGRAHEDAAAYASVALFLERAQAVDSGFQITGANAAAITAICASLDGIPLGIELAATWVATLPCDGIAFEIGRNLGFLTVTTPDLPERQRSLRAAFEHSWNLLTAEEKCALSALSVFRGGFTREAAEQVAGAPLKVLAALVAKSLLARNKAGRYDMHEFIRQYAAVHLAESGHEHGVRRRHVQACLALAEQAESFLMRQESAMQVWRKRLVEEVNNIRAALTFTSVDSPARGLRLAAALGRFWYLQALWDEGRAWLERMLELVTHPEPEDPGIRARALLALGAILKALCEFSAAESRMAESLAIFRALDDRWHTAWALFHLSTVSAAARSDLETAMACARESYDVFRSLEDAWGCGLALSQIGSVALEQGGFDQATTVLQEGLALLRATNDQGAVASGLNLLGTIARIQGDSVRAERYFKESLVFFQQLDNKEGLAWTHYKLGIVALGHCDADRAFEHYRTYLSLSRQLGYKLGVITALEGIARTLAMSGRFEQSARLIGAAAALRDALNLPLSPSDPTALDPHIAAAKAALTDSIWQAEWSIGRSVPLEQVVDEAEA
jgi:predicted ATPase/transcriptional regulator with XRE-family HTH domain